MKPRILLCMLCLLALSAKLIADGRRGADAVVTRKDGQVVKGEIIAVKQDSLVLLGESSKAEISVRIADLDIIKVKTRPGASHVLIVGAATGLGALAGGLLAHSVPFNDHPDKSVAIGAAAGLGVGLIVDLLIKTSRTYKLDGLSPEELNRVLGELRSRARLPDAR